MGYECVERDPAASVNARGGMGDVHDMATPAQDGSGRGDDGEVIAALQERLDRAEMSFAQWKVVAVAFGISLIDGFDVLSATFVLPQLQQDWELDPAQLGVVLAAGLFGMAAGSFFIAPLADLLGRRPLLLFALALAAIGMVLAAHAPSAIELAAYRAGTGLGVGTIMAVMSSVAAESSNRRWRAFVISLIVIGFPAGGMLAGLTATLMFRDFGWGIEFLVGAGLTAAMIPAVLMFMPEPLQSLLDRNVPNRAARINAMLVRMGQPPLDRLPPPPRRHRSYAAIFSAGQRAMTAWITTFQLVLMQCVLFVLSWLPQIVSIAGGGPAVASLAGTAASAMGIVGGLAFGAGTHPANVRRRTMFSTIGLAMAVIALGLSPGSAALLITIGALAGVFAYASQAGFYTILPACFDSSSRATGIGFVLGVARLGSATSPLLAGWLLTIGLGRAWVCASFAVLALAAAALFAVQPNARR